MHLNCVRPADASLKDTRCGHVAGKCAEVAIKLSNSSAVFREPYRKCSNLTVGTYSLGAASDHPRHPDRRGASQKQPFGYFGLG